jgi:tetratricopeptide (TPR) repeat protein
VDPLRGREWGPRERRLVWVAPLAAAAVHARTVGFGFTGLDDQDLVVEDHAFLAAPWSFLKAFGRAYMHVVDPGHAYYRPLVTASYALDARWSGVDPAGYHATNVALYACAAWLVFALLRAFSMPAVVAMAGALAFAVHPALADAVAWIPGRNDALVAVFALAAWVLAMPPEPSGPSPRWPPGRVAACLGFTVLAALTKETAYALPLVWLAQRLFRAAVPAAALLAIVAAVTRGWAGAGAIGFGALPAQLPVLFTSLGAIVFPVSPTVLAVREDVAAWPGVAALVAIAAAALLLPGVRRSVVAFGLAAFALLLAPAILLPGTLILDCRLVLPAVGVFIALAELARAALEGSRAEPRFFVAFTAVAAVVLAAITAGYEGAFRDRRAFARAAVAASPHSPLAHVALGEVYQRDGADDRALAEYRAALDLAPAEVAHNNIAVIHMRAGSWPEAERELRAEIAIDPRYPVAYANLARVLRHLGRDAEADEADAEARALAAP